MLEGVLDLGLVPIGADDLLAGNNKELFKGVDIVGDKKRAIQLFSPGNLLRLLLDRHLEGLDGDDLSLPIGFLQGGLRQDGIVEIFFNLQALEFMEDGLFEIFSRRTVLSSRQS